LAVLFDQRGAGRSRPQNRRADNTLPHLIADMEMIREKFGFERWMLSAAPGCDAGAGLMRKRNPRGQRIVCARPSRHPQRAGRRICRCASALLPDLSEDFLSVLPGEERGQPLDATGAEFSIPIRRCTPGRARLA